jgi:linoleoyl-CoA desaturase
MPRITFNNKGHIFYNALTAEVENYFRTKHLKKTGNWKLYLKTSVLVPAAILIYIFILVFPWSILGIILMAALFGSVLASIGFNVMHDACHGSYSSHKWVNKFFGLSMNALGGNAFIWKQKHNIIHHTYTNIEGIDDDIVQSKFLRQCSTQKWMPVHRFQQYYLLFMYALAIFAWVLGNDFIKYFSKKIHTTPLQKMSLKDHFIFWISKVLYLFFYLMLPVFVMGWGPWLLGFLSMGIVMGITLSVVFQLAHSVEGPEFIIAEAEPKQLESEWAVHQVKTTANFATNNKIISWLVGGLNFQIEHHLFPRVSHVHYPALSKIVKKICQQHNLPYNNFPTMWSAFVSHLRFMKQMGRKPKLMMAKS